jgi:hypothetical protein
MEGRLMFSPVQVGVATGTRERMGALPRRRKGGHPESSPAVVPTYSHQTETTRYSFFQNFEKRMQHGLAGGRPEANAERFFMGAAHPIYVDEMTEAFLRCRAALGGRGDPDQPGRGLRAGVTTVSS